MNAVPGVVPWLADLEAVELAVNCEQARCASRGRAEETVKASWMSGSRRPRGVTLRRGHWVAKGRGMADRCVSEGLTVLTAIQGLLYRIIRLALLGGKMDYAGLYPVA